MKINDTKKNMEKKFQKIPHNHVDIMHELDCLRCKYEQAETSIPKENFIVKVHKLDINKKPTGVLIDAIVTEITVHRGKYDDCVGWSYIISDV